MCCCQMQTRLLCHIWTTGTYLECLSSLVPCRSTIATVALLHSTGDYVLLVEYCQGCPIFFPTPHVESFNFDPPDKRRGGLSDTASSLKRLSSFYTKRNTGDGRAVPPCNINPNTGHSRGPPPLCCIKSNTQGTVGSHPRPV